MRVLLLAPSYDKNNPGESWSTYKWVEGISAQRETVVLTQHKKGWKATDSPVSAQVINWNEPDLPGFNGRLAWELKPAYLWFYFRARKWIKAAQKRGEHFDLIHQINPLALRYPSPARKLGIPYLVGPLAGSLPTPAAFATGGKEKQWFRKLRALDAWRLRHDPWLTSTYAGATAVIGVAPYVEALLTHCRPARFELMAETGVESVAATPKAIPPTDRPLRLLFVGRIIRTKGILEAIEAVGRAVKTHAVTFDVVGAGDLLAECQSTVARLGLEKIITFHGRQTREEVFGWYDRSDVFLFPSYREPSGNVVFEALSRGLPIIASAVGGPGYVVDETCGFRVAPSSREQYIADLASHIVTLQAEPAKIATLSAAALQRAFTLAYWPTKIDQLLKVYRESASAALANK